MFFAVGTLALLVFAAPAVVAQERSYVGAVAEHSLYFGKGTETPSELLQLNLDAYSKLVVAAAENHANIIVFPEFGLTATKDDARDSLYPFMEKFADIDSDNIVNPCDDMNGKDKSFSILAKLSCMAQRNKIAILANVIDQVSCDGNVDTNCPLDGMYLYNCDVVLNEHGEFVAKYHKSHEFPSLMPPYNMPLTPSRVTYKSSWGVEYGIFTCFDIVWPDPPVQLVNAGIQHFLYPVMQGLLGEKVLIEGWSGRHNVTILSSNLGSGKKPGQVDEAADCSGIITNGTPLEAKKVVVSPLENWEAGTPLDNVLIATVPF